MTGEHRDAPDLGAYALGGLSAAEAAGIDEHVAGCADCRAQLTELREMADRLGEVPPEFFLDGPPEGGDLLVQRAVSRVRQERRSALGRRRALVGAAAVAAAVVLVGGGVLAGRGSAPAPTAGGPTTGPVVTSPAVPGTRPIAATDAVTGASITGQVVPAAGWVRVSADVSGIPAGQRCRLVVVGADGTRQVAGSWVVSPKAAADGTALQGFALVDPTQVRSVVVENFDGRRFVTAPVA
jgi:hypothetical protein